MADPKSKEAPAEPGQLPETRLVTATKDGFHGGQRRRKGDQFLVPIGLSGKWLTPPPPPVPTPPVPTEAELQAPPQKAEEQTGSELF